MWRCFIPPVSEGIRIRVTSRHSARVASVLPYWFAPWASHFSEVDGVEPCAWSLLMVFYSSAFFVSVRRLCSFLQLLVALKSARRSAISAARCSAKRCLSSGVTLVSPLGCRTKGLPSLKGGGSDTINASDIFR